MDIRVKNLVSEIEKLDAITLAQLKNLQQKIDDDQSKLDEVIRSQKNVENNKNIISFYQSALKTVTEIIESQKKVHLDDRFTLNYYIQHYSLRSSYAKEAFLSVFGNLANRFSKAVTEYGTKIEGLEAKNVPNLLQEIAETYLEMKNIATHLSSYIDSYITKPLEARKKSLQSSIDQNATNYSILKTDASDKIREKIKALEQLINEINIKHPELILDDKTIPLEEHFVNPYSLCIGLNGRIEEITVTSELIKFQKKYSFAAQQVNLLGYVGEGHTSNMLIQETDNDCSKTFIRNLIIHFLASYPTQNKKVIFIEHQSADTQIFDVMAKVYGCGKNRPFAFIKSSAGVIVEEDSIEKTLQELSDHITRTCTVLGKESVESVYVHNHRIETEEDKFGETLLPIILLIIKDFPRGFSRGNSLSYLRRIFENGNRCGILTMIFYKDEKLERNDLNERVQEFLSSVPAQYRLTATPQYFDSPKTRLLPLKTTKNFDIDNYFARLQEMLEKEQSSAIKLEKIVKDKGAKDNFSKHLLIPIGRSSGGELVTLDLDASNSTHVIVDGSTGSGKTAFLHTLILSAAYKYNPSELQIELFDFKDGAGFKAFEKEPIPHIHFISLRNRISDSLDVLKHLEKEMTRRFKELGNESIETYNNRKKENNEKLLPRLLIVIDEYQKILGNDACVEILKNIATQGRSAGMSLVLSSQTLPTQGNFNEVKQQLAHKFAFRGESDNIERLIPNAGKRAKELEEQKGLCFYQEGSNEMILMRSAFSGDDDELMKNIRDISEKYKKFKTHLRIVGEPTPLIVKQPSDIPYDFYDDDHEAIDLADEYLSNFRLYSYLGKNCITDDEVPYSMNDENVLMVIVGHYIKAKQIVLALLVGILRTLKKVKKNDQRIFIIDLCRKPRLVGMHTPLQTLLELKEDLENNGNVDTPLSAIEYYDYNGFSDAVDNIYDIYEERNNNRLTMKPEPIEVIILNASNLNGDERELDRLKEVLSQAEELGIYFTVQLDKMKCPFVNKLTYSSRERNVDIKDLIILSDIKGDSTTSVQEAFDEIGSIIGKKSLKDAFQNFEENSILEAQSFIIDDKQISKYRHYQFTDDTVKLLVKDLLK